MNRITRTAVRFLCFVMLAALLAPGAHAQFNPVTDIPGGNCKLWLHAGAGVIGNPVTDWQDQSGELNHASQGTPSLQPTLQAAVLNGQPVIRFDGSDGLTLGNNISADFPSAATLFIVSTINNDEQYNLFTTGLATVSDTYWRCNVWCSSKAYNGIFRSDEDFVPEMVATPASGTYVFAVESSSSRWAQWQNGSILNDYSGEYGAGVDYRIGMNDNGDTTKDFSGDIAEIIVYNRVLTPDELNAVGYYLKQKYNITAANYTLPTTTTTTSTTTTTTTSTTTTSTTTTSTTTTSTTTTTTTSTTTTSTTTTTTTSTTTTTLAQFNPVTDIPGNNCQLWLKADAGVVIVSDKVTTWEDQSGNDRDASQVTVSLQPTLQAAVLNGEPVIRFDGGDGLTLGNLSAAFPSAATLFIVSALYDLDNNYNLFTTYSAADTWWRIGDYGFHNGYNGVFRSDTNYDPVMAMTPSGGSHVLTVESSSSRWAMWDNGSILNDGSIWNDFPGEYGAGDDYRIGMPNRDGGSGDMYLTGDIAEIIAYSRVLTADELNAVGDYLNQKYGITGATYTQPTTTTTTTTSTTTTTTTSTTTTSTTSTTTTSTTTTTTTSTTTTTVMPMRMFAKAEVKYSATGGGPSDLIGTAEVANDLTPPAVGFSLTPGYLDSNLFTITAAGALTKTDKATTAVGTYYWVEITATAGGFPDDKMLVRVKVISGTPTFTVFQFK